MRSAGAKLRELWIPDITHLTDELEDPLQLVHRPQRDVQIPSKLASARLTCAFCDVERYTVRSASPLRPERVQFRLRKHADGITRENGESLRFTPHAESSKVAH